MFRCDKRVKFLAYFLMKTKEVNVEVIVLVWPSEMKLEQGKKVIKIKKKSRKKEVSNSKNYQNLLTHSLSSRKTKKNLLATTLCQSPNTSLQVFVFINNRAELLFLMADFPFEISKFWKIFWDGSDYDFFFLKNVILNGQV